MRHTGLWERKTGSIRALILGVSCALSSVAFGAGQVGPQVPAKDLPVPLEDVSPQAQGMISAPRDPRWNLHPKDASEWKDLVKASAEKVIATLPQLRKELGVKVELTQIAGVNCYIVTPDFVAEENRDRLLVHLHSGGYVFSSGEAATREAILMAGLGRFKVVSVDYRMPPDFPFPAAVDDAAAVWRELASVHDPRKMAVFGTSAGGGLTLALVLRARQLKLPLPAAIAPGTPWADLNKTGDSYFINEMIDNVLVSYDGWIGDAVKLYANGHDVRDPLLSPIYGDFQGFPPALLTSGTRDLFLSNTVRTHRKLRRAGVEAELHVFEGLSHSQFRGEPTAPEVKEHFGELARFFDSRLAK